MRTASRSRHAPWIVLALMVLPLSIAACSSASSTPSKATVQTSTTTSPANQTACALITPFEVKATMGTTVGAPHAVVRGSVTTCTYKAAVPSNSVIIEYNTAATPATFAADKSQIEQREGVTATSIGSQAYAFTLRSSGEAINTVVTLQGTLQTIVTGTSPPGTVENMAEEIIYLINRANATTTTTSKPPG